MGNVIMILPLLVTGAGAQAAAHTIAARLACRSPVALLVAAPRAQCAGSIARMRPESPAPPGPQSAPPAAWAAAYMQAMAAGVTSG